MTSVALLIVLGVIILIIGWIVVIVAGFRVSFGWGAAALFPPGWLLFALLRWNKARDGVVIVVVGMLLPMAAFYLLVPVDDRDKFLSDARARLEQLRAPDPFAAAPGKPGSPTAGGPQKQSLPPIPQTQVLDFSSVGGAAAPTDVAIRTPSTVVAPTQGLLETEAQVTAALAELTKLSTALSGRKEQFKGTTNTAELLILKSEIDAYNKRLTEVRTAEVRLARTRAAAAAQARLARVPAKRVQGNLMGKPFVMDAAALDRKRALLTLRQGDESAPDAVVTIAFGARVDEVFLDRSVVREPAPADSPPVTITLRRGGAKPVTKTFNQGYGVNVEFVEDGGDSRIILTLPDDTRSVLQGTFRIPPPEKKG